MTQRNHNNTNNNTTSKIIQDYSVCCHDCIAYWEVLKGVCEWWYMNKISCGECIMYIFEYFVTILFLTNFSLKKSISFLFRLFSKNHSPLTQIDFIFIKVFTIADYFLHIYEASRIEKKLQLKTIAHIHSRFYFIFFFFCIFSFMSKNFLQAKKTLFIIFTNSWYIHTSIIRIIIQLIHWERLCSIFDWSNLRIYTTGALLFDKKEKENQ